jgi:hypothetical protein
MRRRQGLLGGHSDSGAMTEFVYICGVKGMDSDTETIKNHQHQFRNKVLADQRSIDVI